MADLPNWVYDLVMDLQRWEDEHPTLYAQYAGSDAFQKVSECGCGALKRVPADVIDQARTLREYLRQAATCTCRSTDVRNLGDPEPRFTVTTDPDCPIHGGGG